MSILATNLAASQMKATEPAIVFSFSYYSYSFPLHFKTQK
jgi:hypothetical protein